MRTANTALIGAAGLLLAACGGSESADAAATTKTEEIVAAVSQDKSDDTDHSHAAAIPEGSLSANKMILGNAEADVQLVTYASVTCPACAAFHERIYPRLKAEYIDTGKISYEYREFPTGPVNLSYAGFYLARCAANTKGAPAYFAIVDTLYKRQSDWVYGPTPGEELQNIAAQAGIDREGLESCFNRQDVKDAVQDNVRYGLETDNIKATPSFVVNGKELEWDRSRGEQGFIDAIEEALSN